MNKKKIALLIHKLTSGGAQRMIANLSQYLHKYYEVHVIVFDGKDATYETKGILHDLSLPASDSKNKQLITLFRRISAVKKIKKRYHIDCTISFLDGPNLVNFFAKCDDKRILSVRSYLSLTKMTNFRQRYIKYISNHTDCTVAISKLVEKDLNRNFGVLENKLTTIYNACDIQMIQKMAKREPDFILDKQNSLFYFVTIGRPVEAKGHWHLIRAFKKVQSIYPETRLIIGGEGNYRKKLIELIKKMNLQEVIFMPGNLDNPHAIVAQCDVFVFSSIYEGFGNVLVDALALSMPIVSTDCLTGPRTILAPETDPEYQTTEIEKAEYGILVPADNKEHFNPYDPLTREEEILADGMLEMFRNRELREEYASKACDRANDFSVEVTTKSWVDLINRFCMNK